MPTPADRAAVWPMLKLSRWRSTPIPTIAPRATPSSESQTVNMPGPASSSTRRMRAGFESAMNRIWQPRDDSPGARRSTRSVAVPTDALSIERSALLYSSPPSWHRFSWD